jgi:diaminopimelate decarboxylase
MSEKNLPFTENQLREIIEKFPTPFHIYDERAIRKNARDLLEAFAWAHEFKEYFAVKALPNPHILKILRQEGFGADCSSMAELLLSEHAGLRGEEIIFSSNATPYQDFSKAKELGAVINLDDISHITYLEKHTGLPELLSFRYNPGPARSGGNAIIGNPAESKYGLTHKQLLEAYALVKSKRVKRFGLHTMVVSNELDSKYLIETADMLFDLVVEIHQNLGIKIEMVNTGGGIGIPYHPDETGIDLHYLGESIRHSYNQRIRANNLHPIRLTMESGRMITGPYGYLVTKVLHKKDIYKKYVGLDACMADLMRPGLYGAYHHITVLGKENQPVDHIYDVTGSLCENNDKFAINRPLPHIDLGDILVMHDTGAHGHAMGFNYNGKLRPAELLWQADGKVKMIRRAETVEDYFATLDFSQL